VLKLVSQIDQNRFGLEIFMKKFALLVAAAASLMSSGVFAQSASTNFNVQVNLLSRCQVASGAGTLINFGDYTAFGSAANTAPSISLTLNCTRGLVPSSLVFDTDTDRASSAAGLSPTATGVLAGLQYSLAVTTGTVTAGTAPTTAAGSTNTPDARAYSVTGTMAAGQAGSCTGASCSAFHQRTLTISY
jgi:spore coat protein U-like protein